MRNIGFRADADERCGFGHVIRCFSLAQELQKKGSRIRFFSSRMPESLAEDLKTAGINIDPPETLLDADLDCIVVDSYEVGREDERKWKEKGWKILAIDDLARPHHCDILLDSHFYQNGSHRYEGRLLPSCRSLLGPHYSLLRREFREHRPPSSKTTGLKKLFISFGGADLGNITEKVARAVFQLSFIEGAVVVLGETHPQADSLSELHKRFPKFQFFRQPGNVAALMADCDLAIGAAGTSSWERCCLGLPSLLINLVPHQEEIAQGLQSKGVAWNLGLSSSGFEDKLVSKLEEMHSDPTGLIEMRKRALAFVDGLGAERVASLLIGEA